ncbi:hypothetical protein NMG29_06280 [Streptomyces cocklensis]|uniref:Flagellar motor switch protein FliM n=1 Tax=Actinacidiphila cocklensis TaxID=887465 RepID=A0A9W4DY14_9ACTN|nr:hypothetical protein [Actinacidiphila cocklensis]MDD1057837.1 hypothetical protein [Actinacidiphila cocklensis]WSX78681.1 hypothetical protein OH826_35450 [Streptomyces sp. NBC_00899]CAG6398573.1 Flagellar motor switch protein FliM [Actinacidiphila cocklensis]
MSFETEWAGIKQEVAGGPVLTLAHADAGGGGGGTADATGGDAGMASDIAAWKAAAKGVGTLADNLTKAAGKLEEAQQGMDTSLLFSNSSFDTLQAQGELHPTWSGYVSSLLTRCAALKEQLTAAGATLCISDEAVRAEFDKLDDGYKDTPAVGGQSLGG